jgi:hypothetical protein
MSDEQPAEKPPPPPPPPVDVEPAQEFRKNPETRTGSIQRDEPPPPPPPVEVPPAIEERDG